MNGTVKRVSLGTVIPGLPSFSPVAWDSERVTGSSRTGHSGGAIMEPYGALVCALESANKQALCSGHHESALSGTDSTASASALFAVRVGTPKGVTGSSPLVAGGTVMEPYGAPSVPPESAD
jgi:hypothetical protein